MHTLPIPNVRVHLAPNEKHIHKSILGIRLSKVLVLRHASLYVLKDFLAEVFVLFDDVPGRLFKA